jgi:hypothetical protein
MENPDAPTYTLIEIRAMMRFGKLLEHLAAADSESQP